MGSEANVSHGRRNFNLIIGIIMCNVLNIGCEF